MEVAAHSSCGGDPLENKLEGLPLVEVEDSSAMMRLEDIIISKIFCASLNKSSFFFCTSSFLY